MTAHIGNRKVYVGNLGNFACKEELTAAFAAYGEVEKVFVAKRPPGFAFVVFQFPHDAARAIQNLDGTLICGRWVKVEPFIERSQRHLAHRSIVTPNTIVASAISAQVVAPPALVSGIILHRHPFGEFEDYYDDEFAYERHFHDHDPVPTPPTSTQSAPKAPPKPSLANFKSPEDINALSVKELKEILDAKLVKHGSCLEKTDLVEKVVDLWINFNITKAEAKEEDPSDDCKICMDGPLDCVLLECGHMISCYRCGSRLTECPVCRMRVTRVVKTFKS